MERIPASGTLKMFDLARKIEAEGKRVFHFEVGQPDFPTPQNIINAGIQALKDGHTRYTSSRGIPSLLQAIESFYQHRGMKIDGGKNVIVTPGAKMALFQGFLSTIDTGDDVLLLAPAWPTYRVMARTANAKPVDVNTEPGYELNREALKNAASRSVTALVINSPNNPSGGVLSKDDLKFIYDLAVDRDFVIFSDEIYEALLYDETQKASMLEVDTTLERTLVINGFSKTYAMTGWRLGFAIGNEEVIDNMVRIQQNTTSCAAAFVQCAGVEALEGDQSSITMMINEYQERRNLIKKLINRIPGVKCITPKGAFYAFPDFSAVGLSSQTLAELVLRKTGICTTPGIVFGKKYDNNLRFSYATSVNEIEEGLELLTEFIPTLY
jgi:aspartate/methionine/tyrosine aminotransferase